MGILPPNSAGMIGRFLEGTIGVGFCCEFDICELFGTILCAIRFLPLRSLVDYN